MKLNTLKITAAFTLALTLGASNASFAISAQSAEAAAQAAQNTAQLLNTPRGIALLESIQGTAVAAEIATLLNVPQFEANNPIVRMALQSKLSAGDKSVYSIAMNLQQLNQAVGSDVTAKGVQIALGTLTLTSSTVATSSASGDPVAPMGEATRAIMAAKFANKVKTNAPTVFGSAEYLTALQVLNSGLWSKVQGPHYDLCLAADTDFTDPVALEKMVKAFAAMSTSVDLYSQNPSDATALNARNAFHQGLVNQGVGSQAACNATMNAEDGCGVVLPAAACGV